MSGLASPRLAVAVLLLWPSPAAGTQSETTLQFASKKLITAADISPDGTLLAYATIGDSLVESTEPIKVVDLKTGREVRTLVGKAGMVHRLKFSADSRRLASGHAYKTVKLWDVSSGRQLQALTGHDGYITGVAFDSQGRLLASSSGTDLWLWDADTGRLRNRLTGHSGVVHGVALSPDGRWLGSTSFDKTVRIWNVETGREHRNLSGLEDEMSVVVFSPDGRWLAAGSPRDGTVRIWEVATGNPGPTLRGHEAGVGSLLFSPDGRRLASHAWREAVRIWELGSDRGVQALEGKPDSILAMRFDSSGGVIAFEQMLSGNDARYRLWKAALPPPPQLAAARPSSRPELFVQAGHVGGIWAIAFSPDGRWLASGGQDKKVVLWDTRNWLGFRTLESEADWVESLAFDPQGRWLAAGHRNSRLTLWDLGPGGESFSLGVPAGARGGVRVTFSPDGRLMASGHSNSQVVVWETGTWKKARVFELRLGDVSAVAISSDSRLLAAASVHETAIWDLATGQSVRRLEFGGSSLAFSPGGKLLAVGPSSRDNRGFDVYETATGNRIQTLGGFTWAVWGLAFSADGRRLAAGGGQVLKVFDLDSFGETISLGDASREYIQSVAFSPDGLWLAAAGRDSAVRVWGMPTGTAARTVSGDVTINSDAAFSPDGRWLAAGSTRLTGDSALRIWDAGSGLLLHRLNEQVDALAFAPDGRSIAAGNWNGEVSVRDPATGKTLQAFHLPRGGHDPVFSVSFSPDGDSLAAGLTGGVRVWDWKTGKERVPVSPDGRWLVEAGGKIGIREIPPARESPLLQSRSGGIHSTAVSPDGRFLAAAGARDKTVRLWDAETGHELRAMTGHTDEVKAVSFHASGRLLVSAAMDGTLRIWNAPKGDALALLACVDGTNDWVVATPDGLFDGTPDGIRKLVAWRFGDGALPLELFFNEFFHPGLLADLLSEKRPKAPRDIDELDRRQPQVRFSDDVEPQRGSAAVANRNRVVRLEVAEAPADGQHPMGSGARDVRLFRNGSLVHVWRGDVLAGKEGKTALEVTVPVRAGENHFTAYAFNRDNIKSADASLVVRGADSLKRSGTAYIVAIGVNRYANADYNLSYAVADAQAFAEELRKQQAALGSFGSVEVVPLLDQDATRANVLWALRRLSGSAEALPPKGPVVLQKIKRAEPEDAVFVYYAGHGTAQGPRFHLLPHDIAYTGKRTALDADGIKAILSHTISDLDLEQAFERLDAGRLVLVIDACNSGQALEAEEKRRGPMNSKGLAQLAYEKGMYILAAAQGYQAALEASQLGHGYLTYALVEEGLKSPAADAAPKDGQVVLREWLDYATQRVPQMQAALLNESHKAGRELAFVEGEQAVEDLAKRSLQSPRVFYRREAEREPFVVARPARVP